MRDLVKRDVRRVGMRDGGAAAERVRWGGGFAAPCARRDGVLSRAGEAAANPHAAALLALGSRRPGQRCDSIRAPKRLPEIGPIRRSKHSDPWRTALVARLAAWLLRALAATWRVRFEGPDPLAVSLPKACVAAVWHRNILIGAGAYRDLGLTVAISRSRDGDLVSSVVERLGWAPPPRGSSSRGASAVFLELLRALRAGSIVVMLCDGPRGPARRSKSGTVHLARSSGVPIVPLGISARPCKRFSSWDGTLLPWPFARIVVRYGDPIEVPADASDDDVEVIRKQLDDALNRLTDDLCGVDPACCAR